jgi:histidine triad (HIT) family protein
MDTCIFCKILNGSAPAHKIWENENFFSFLDINPVNPGHTMIIPKHHIDYVFDLGEPLYSELFRVAKELSEPIKRATQASRIGVVIEGFSVSHLHVHLVPMNDVNELNPTRATRATAEELVAVAINIRNELA